MCILNEIFCSNLPELPKFILKFQDHTTGNQERNPYLALLHFWANEVYHRRSGQRLLLIATTDYFRDFASKLTCFKDLKSPLLYLDSEAQKCLLDNITRLAQESKPKAHEPEVRLPGSLNALYYPRLLLTVPNDPLDHQRNQCAQARVLSRRVQRRELS